MKNVYMLRILSFSKALMWKHWHTNVDTTPFPDRAKLLSSTTAKSPVSIIWSVLMVSEYMLIRPVTFFIK